MIQLENSHQNIIDDELMAALLDTMPSGTPPDTLRAQILARIHSPSSMNELITVRADEGRWSEMAPGIEIKLLFQDKDSNSRSLLMRVHAGSTFPAHGHDGLEECLLLEGECNFGSLNLRAGDYHLALQGANHVALSSRTGALLFLRTCVTQYPLVA